MEDKSGKALLAEVYSVSHSIQSVSQVNVTELISSNSLYEPFMDLIHPSFLEKLVRRDDFFKNISFEGAELPIQFHSKVYVPLEKGLEYWVHATRCFDSEPTVRSDINTYLRSKHDMLCTQQDLAKSFFQPCIFSKVYVNKTALLNPIAKAVADGVKERITAIKSSYVDE